MIGGMKKTVSRLALAAAVVGLSTPVLAADLGGSCCADLEERIAELEATTVRKGNRVVSVRITGTVASRVWIHNSDAEDAIRANKGIIDQDDGSTAFQITGSATVSSDISVGFRMDIDVNDTDVDDDDESVQLPTKVDDLYIYVESKRLGRVTVGRVDQAMDGINAISLADINDVQLDNSDFTSFLGTGYTEAGDLDGTDDEGGSILYTSPSVAGFVFSASYGHRSAYEIQAERDADWRDNDGSDIWSVALRYAGEFNGIRVAAGVGYEEEQTNFNTDTQRETGMTGSVSVMHAPSGAFVNFAAGTEETTNRVDGSLDSEKEAWAVVAGVERKFIALGNTTIYGFYNNIDDSEFDEEAQNWGFGLTQIIDAAATRFNLMYTRFECVGDGAFNSPSEADIDAGIPGFYSCTDDADVFSTGLAIRF